MGFTKKKKKSCRTDRRVSILVFVFARSIHGLGGHLRTYVILPW
jgi:hypothetical protein